MKTILLIEDNSDIRENMGEIMELAGYNVLLAPDGKQGVRLANEHLPDIIICDIMMPELDGYGVIHMLQKNEATKHIPFIFLTAKAERSEMRRGMEMGADDYITKPFSGTELLAAIESRLKKADDSKKETKGSTEVISSTEVVVNLEDLFEQESSAETYRKKQVIYAVRNHATRLYRIRSG
jgi:CRP/FNR family cyclic AMP-dependent transcriptional regulator